MKNRVAGFVILLLFYAGVDVCSGRSVSMDINTSAPQLVQLFQLTRDTAEVGHLIRAAFSIIEQHSDSAIRMYQKAAVLSQRIGYNDGTAEALMMAGNILVANGNPKEGKILLLKALPYCQNAYFSRDHLITRWLKSAGIPYYSQGDYTTAMKYFAGGLEYLERTSPEDMKSRLGFYVNIGNACHGIGNEEQALYYWKKAEKLALLTNSNGDLPNIYNCLSVYYNIKKQFDTGRKYCEKSIQTARETGNLSVATRSSENLSTTYYYQGNFKRSAEILESCLEWYIANPGKNRYSIYSAMGSTYLKLGEYKKSEDYLKKALDLVNKEDMLSERLGVYGNLSVLYLQTSKYKLFNEYHEKYDILRDSLFDKGKQEAVNNLEIRYRTAEKDKELIRKQLMMNQQQSELNQKNLWIGFISSGSMMLMAFSGFFYQRHRNKQQQQARQIQVLQQEQEVSNLKFMMTGEEKERTRLARELHDGIMVQLSMVKSKFKTLPDQFGDISSREYFKTAYYQQTLEQFEEATRELRQTAHNLMPDMLLKGGLADAVLYFCNNIKQNTNLHIDFQQYGEIPRLEPTVEISLYRIVQELIQNIIKHAHAREAIVQLTKLDNYMLSIVVEDNGIGFDTERMNRSAGMGLTSIHTRVRALNGSLEVQSEPDAGTTVHLEFNLLSMIQPNDLTNVH